MSNDMIEAIRVVALVYAIGYGILVALMGYNLFKHGYGLCSRGASPLPPPPPPGIDQAREA